MSSRLPVDAVLRSSLKASSTRRLDNLEANKHVTFACQRSRGGGPQAKGLTTKNVSSPTHPCDSPRGVHSKQQNLVSPRKRQKQTTAEEKGVKRNKHNEAVVRLSEVQKTLVGSLESVVHLSAKAEEARVDAKRAVSTALPLAEKCLLNDLKKTELLGMMRSAEEESDSLDEVLTNELGQLNSICDGLEQFSAMAERCEANLEEICGPEQMAVDVRAESAEDGDAASAPCGVDDDEQILARIDLLSEGFLAYQGILSELANFHF